MATPLLQTRSLSKRYHRGAATTHVLDNISFSLYPGEVLVVLGTSGSGKSTLLRLLAGLEHPDTGEITTSVARPGPSLSYLPQGEMLLPWRTVEENIHLAFSLRRLRHSANRREEVEKLLQSAGIYAQAAWYPVSLSGGMAQRALFARALAAEPKLLLLDEPFSQLDLIARRSLANVLRSYNARTGASAIVVTHSLEEALAVSDRVIVLSRAPASPRQVYSVTDAPDGTASSTLTRERGYPILEQALLAAQRDGGSDVQP